MTEPGGRQRRSYERPYAGIRVLDLSQGIAGPNCGSLLAHYGAEVIKVEPPEGDWARKLGTRYGDHSAIDLACNRGKRSIAIDLKTPDGRRLVQRMASGSDVMLESFRPGVAARLGIGYDEMRRRNPRLLYVSVSGYGQSGPYAERPGSDTVLQAYSGFMALNRDDQGKPNRVGFLAIDQATSLYAFQAVATALHARDDEAEGRHIDVSLMQSAAAFVATKIIESGLEGAAPRLVNAPAGSYRTRDGWIAVTLTRESHFTAMCRVLGREDLPKDERFANFAARADNVAALKPLVAEALATRTTEEWLPLFAAADVLASRINTLSDWLADPQAVASEAASSAMATGVPSFLVPRIPGSAPVPEGDPRAHCSKIGGEGSDILRDLGCSPAEIDALVAAGAVILPKDGG